MLETGYYWVKNNPELQWLIPFRDEDAVEIAHYDATELYFPWTRMLNEEGLDRVHDFGIKLPENVFIVVGERLLSPKL